MSLIECNVTTTDIKNATSFQEAITLYLRKEGITYAQFADLLGYSSMHIWGVSNGKYPLTYSLAKKLMSVTKVDRIFWIELWLNTYDKI